MTEHNFLKIEPFYIQCPRCFAKHLLEREAAHKRLFKLRSKRPLSKRAIAEVIRLEHWLDMELKPMMETKSRVIVSKSGDVTCEYGFFCEMCGFESEFQHTEKGQS